MACQRRANLIDLAFFPGLRIEHYKNTLARIIQG
jgi:hypothetical protein